MITVGWREWVSLPDFKIRAVRAKVDTGAFTSAIHAEDIKIYRTIHKVRKARFRILLARDRKHRRAKFVWCRAVVTGRKSITSSNGAREKRWVIRTTLQMGGEEWPIELSLSSRKTMQHRILLGRQALRNRCVIDPGHSFLLERKRK